MFIFKTALSRRTLLRGLGASLALPFMDAMVPAFTATVKTAANSRRRFGVVFVPLGERPGFWTPETLGRDFELSPILSPLAPHRESLTVVSGLDGPSSGHAPSDSGWLSGSLIKRTAAEDVRAGTTIDQVIASKIGHETVLPSLEIATADWSGYIGNCDGAYACAYASSISWKTPTTPLPSETNPRLIFERLFGSSGTTAQRVERLQRRQSVIDAIKQDVRTLERGLGGGDRARLSNYLDNVREVEQRIAKAEDQAASNVDLPDAPVGVPAEFEAHVELMFDLLALTYQADITRVFSFMMDRDLTQRAYPNLGITEPHHSMSHHGNDPEKMRNLVKVNIHHVTMFEKFIGRLKATPDGDGSLLDHSIILFGSGMSESNSHSNIDVPTLLVGGGAGLLPTGRHIKASSGTPLANLLLALGQKYGAEIDEFGLSTGRLEL